ncbi:MAG: heterodisulfide reductase [Candidatus Hydromicrobium americanum]|nr:MAG: heterodisulfide reductase [Candidatus Hydromicrobium americanum]
MISLTINGKKIEVEEGLTVLKAAEKLGIKIPTLCSHKALSPYGACRLCLVEISRGEGSPEIHASCTYPALEGMVVQTDSERVIKTRKIMIELLLARCPDSEDIKNLARELGVEKIRIKSKNKDCTLCGLCVRMCEERMGRAAISFSGRGPRREVTSPFGKPSEVCQACGACDFICPTGKIKLPEVSKNNPRPIPFEHNMGINSRPAVYIPYPQAIPNKATIDSRYCVHMLRDECEICKEFCEAGAIDYNQKEEKLDLKVGSIIFSPGYDLFDAGAKLEYGYLNYSNVVTALEFERILSASGPYEGKVLRPSDKLIPKKIAFIQCVGSRDTERDYCSSICCMYATKEAIIAKEHAGEELECHIYFMDMRAFGKGFDAYYERAKELGVKYIRCRPSSVEEIAETKNLKINYVTDEGKRLTDQYDLVVLSVGMQPPGLAKELNSNFGIELNEHGFCWTDPFKPVESSKEGIFVCGPFTEPKDIPETVVQAGGAASKVLSLLSEVRGTLIKTKEYPPEKDVTGQAPRIGVFVCHCGTNIAGVVNVPGVVEYAKTLPDVAYVENNLYTCSNDTQEKIKNLIEKHNLNRVVVASCTPRTHEPLFRNTIREAKLNPYLFEMANIRDQCSWVHMHEPEKATRKAKDLVRMAVAKVRLLEPLQRRKVKVNNRALVIGGGLSGMSAALGIAEQGYEVYLVEKEKQLGGNLQNIHFLFNGGKTQEQLDSLIGRVKENDKIHLYTDTKISNIEGFIGNFKTTLETGKGKSDEIEHGVIIVATGAQEYKPTEYLYGEDEKVITQLQLEEWLAANGKQPDNQSSSSQLANCQTAVMIQCVGSRDDKHPYCSRVCCSEAVKNALKIKEINPKTNIFILYRDMRTYGFRESYYTKARQMGVIFIRYEEDKKPEVAKQNGVLKVSLVDPILNRLVTINTDLLVLSAGIIPHPENKDLAQMLKVPLDQDNFFLEAHMKLRPVDFATEGVFLCGLAHSAKSIEESIAQACGAAARASTILSKDNIELEANISFVVDENCDGCAYCIDPCPYNALALIEYMKDGAVKKTVEVDESACKGCGVCQATCPKKGIFVRGFKLEQISAQVEAAMQSADT